MLTGCASTNSANRVTKNTYGVRVEELKISNGDNTIYGKLVSPVPHTPDNPDKYPLIIGCHGYNGHHYDFSNDFAYFASQGFLCYSFDFCGGSVSSLSTMSTTKMTLFTETSDLIAVFNYLSQLENVDKEHIYLFGQSQGGIVSTIAATELKEKVKGLLLYYPALCIPDNWRDNAKANPSIYDVKMLNFWGMNLGKAYFDAIRNFDPYEKLAEYSGKVIIVHGTNDQIVPLSYSQKAVKVYGKENCSLVVLDGEGHGYSLQGAVTARNYIHKFIQKNY